MATMGDIAKIAGVSLSTVSYVLSGDRPISEATRQKVLAAMATTDYRPNALARGLASRRSHILALLARDAGHGFGATEMAIVQAASAAARARGYHLVLWTDDDPAGLADLAGQGLVDGVLLMEVHLEDQRIPVLEKAGLPLICIGRAHLDGTEASLPSIDIDYHRTMALAVEEVLGQNIRSMALINQSSDAKTHGYGPAIRIGEAYKSAMEAHGLPCLEVESPSHAAGGLAALGQLVPELEFPAAVLVMNDRAVPGILKGLAERGLRVPKDVSVLSLLSSAPMAEQSVPALSSLEVPAEELAQLGIAALVGLLEPHTDKPASAGKQTLVPCKLVLRDSTRGSTKKELP